MTALPIGGSTGLDHQDHPQIDEAAAWLAAVSPAERPRPIVPALRQRFGLTAPEACQAIREATLRHGRAT